MRVQVSLSDDMVKRVDKYAHMMGVSRSALCSVLVGQGIMNYDNAFNLMGNAVDKMVQDGQVIGQMDIEDVIED